MEENQFRILLCGPKISRLAPFFSPHGYKIEVTETGKEAFKRLQNSTFNTLLFELNLIDIDSHDFIQQIKIQNKHLPCILLEDSSKATNIVAIMALGINAYVSTPPNEQHLFEEVKRLCENNYLRNLYLEKDNTLEKTFISNDQSHPETSPKKLSQTEQSHLSCEASQEEDLDQNTQKSIPNISGSESLADSFEEFDEFQEIKSESYEQPGELQPIALYIPGNTLNHQQILDEDEYAETIVVVDTSHLSQNSSSIQAINVVTNASQYSSIALVTDENAAAVPQNVPAQVTLADIQEQAPNPYSQESAILLDDEYDEKTVIRNLNDSSKAPSFDSSDVALLAEFDSQKESHAEAIPAEAEFEESTMVANIEKYQIFRQLNDRSCSALEQVKETKKSLSQPALLSDASDEIDDDIDFDIDFDIDI